MSPPSVIGPVVRPGPVAVVMELEKAVIGAAFALIGPCLIVAGMLIDSLCVQPFVKGAAVIEHSVQNYPHPPLMDFLHKPGKKCIAGFQILLACAALHVPVSLFVIRGVRPDQAASVLLYSGKVGINVLVILAVILMVGGGYKYRIQIDGLHSQLLDVVQLIPDSLQVASVKVPHIHGGRVPVPFRNLLYRTADIDILI